MTVEADKLFVPEETLRDGSGAIISQAERPETPKTAPLLPDVSRSFSAIVQIAKDVLVNPDVAVRTDYRLADQMLHDPMVMAPLQKRLLATAQLPYEIVPENPSDPHQKAVCANLTRIVKRIPRLQELFRSLGMATFRGTGASEINWTEVDADTGQYEIDNHRPYHGDKITYDIYGNPRILTRDYQTGGRQLDKGEKDRLIIHTFDREDGEFYDGAQAGYVFKGRGVRDVIWPYWFLKINATRFWVTLLERFGTGWVEGRYPAGNLEAKNGIESVLQNLVNDSKYSLPVPSGLDATNPAGSYGITVHKLDGIGESAKLFTDFVEGWAGKHIRMVIEGQEQAQQEGGDGLGSGRADALADIFRMYRDYDAGLLEDTLTDQLLGKIIFFNYGRLSFRPLFHFITEKADYDEQMKRVQAAKEAGMRVPRRWLNETLDVPELTGEELPDEIIDFGAQQAGMQPGQDAGDALFMDGHEPAAMREMFREALGGRVRYDDEGRWITIGSHEEHGGGTHVFVKDGKIAKGPAGLTGKKLGELGKRVRPAREVPAGTAGNLIHGDTVHTSSHGHVKIKKFTAQDSDHSEWQGAITLHGETEGGKAVKLVSNRKTPERGWQAVEHDPDAPFSEKRTDTKVHHMGGDEQKPTTGDRVQIISGIHSGKFGKITRDTGVKETRFEGRYTVAHDDGEESGYHDSSLFVHESQADPEKHPDTGEEMFGKPSHGMTRDEWGRALANRMYDIESRYGKNQLAQTMDEKMRTAKQVLRDNPDLAAHYAKTSDRPASSLAPKSLPEMSIE